MIVILPLLGISIVAFFCPLILLFIEVFSLIKRLKEKKQSIEVPSDEKK